ncbi:hypothetical protein BOTBODRAFT_122019, partial [Botryobasidium botryosum FD-172 SS1]
MDSPDVHFRSREQASAIAFTLARVGYGSFVLPTGAGKSLIFQLPAWLERSQPLVTVVFVPYASLREDHNARAKALGIPSLAWGSGVRASASLVFVVVESAVKDGFYGYCKELVAKNQIARFVVDEFHTLATQADYRDAFALLGMFATLGPIQWVLLSGTAGLALERRVLEGLGLNPSVVTYIRAPTSRANVAYRVRPVPRLNSNMVALVQGELAKNLKGPADRALVFCLTTSLVDTLSAALGALAYHARMDEDTRRINFAAFKAGGEGCSVMVASSAFSTGVHVPSIRQTIHIGLPRSTIDFLQESGRAGRDGQRAEALI